MKNKIAFINGTVLTVDSKNSIAEALIVENEKIAGVGKYGDLKGSVDANTEVIDLDGRSIVPGFIDSHRFRRFIMVRLLSRRISFGQPMVTLCTR